ncbi:MAG: TIGR03773 family transporter-associated surface protein [Actinobacteria bacterium]|nr:TIGR03773 family transporter-associated surface protein [Actinomycetota bacterium]
MLRLRVLSILLAAGLLLGPVGAPLIASAEEPVPSPVVSEATSPSPEPEATAEPAPSPSAAPAPEATSDPHGPTPEPAEGDQTGHDASSTESPVREPSAPAEPTVSVETPSAEPSEAPSLPGPEADPSELPTPDSTKTRRSLARAVVGEVGSGVRSRVLTKGHIDLFEVTWNGGLRLSVKDDTNLYSAGSQYRSPADVTIWVDTGGSTLQVPAAPGYGFLGNPGDTIYHLPLSQDPELPWPGWSTERLLGTLPSETQLPNSADAVRLAVEVTGPGEVFSWMTGGFGTVTNRYVDTVDPAPDVIPISRNAHVHTAWAFTRPGDYYLSVTPTATTTGGDLLTGDTAVYHVRIAPIAGAAPTATSTPTISGDATVASTLTLAPGDWHPMPHQVSQQWLRDGQPIAGATGRSYTTTQADDGRTVSARVTAAISTASRTVPAAGIAIGATTAPSPTPTPTTTPSPRPKPTPTSAPTATPKPTPRPTATPTPRPSPTPSSSGPRWKVANGTRTESGAAILNLGHVDVASLLSGKKLVTRVKDTTESSVPVWREPEQTVLQVLPNSRVSIPADDAYRFLGKPGAASWLLPETQDAALLWPGWSTEEIATDATRTTFDWTLTGVDGPGEFALFTSGGFGVPQVHFNTRDGLPDTMPIDRRVHVHGSWAFSAEGTYCLAFTRATTLAGGTRVSDDFTLAMAVGDVEVRKVDPSRCAEPAPGKPSTTPAPDPSPTATATPTPDPKPTKQASKAANRKCVSGATILSAGHIDYASRIVGGRLQSLIGDDTGGKKVYREPSGVILWLKPSAQVTLPSGYGRIGKAGAKIWQVPQTQVRDLIWLGWNTELLNAGNAKGAVTWRLDSVRGPSSVKVYLSGSFGGVSTMVLKGAGSSYQIPLGVHAHANWAFSKQGVYRLKMTQTVTLANGKRSSDTETLTIAVGDVDPASAGSGSGCGTVSQAKASGVDTTTDAATELKSAEQAEAEAAENADQAPVRGQPGQPGGRGPRPVTADDPAAEGGEPRTSSVPMLLSVLGGLLLAGAAGTGGLWLGRRQGSA